MTRAETSFLPAPIPLAPVFRALADPTRLRIVRLLLQGPLCVGDLVTVLDLPQPKVSRHLASLRRAGLVEDEKRGLWCFYRLTAQSGPQRKILAVLHAAAAEVAGAADDDALRRLRKKGGCCPQHQRAGRTTP
ncbi:MAG TPA: metalloregulator ArsR/SmtB family transcription factor [Myxococcales bacterium]